jgi:hypothetical protein
MAIPRQERLGQDADLKPRWLTAALKSGKSLEAFAITAGK